MPASRRPLGSAAKLVVRRSSKPSLVRSHFSPRSRRVVDPAAGAGPDLARLAGDRLQAEHLGVEDHAVEHPGPGLAGVVALVGAAARCRRSPLSGLVGIDHQAGDLLHVRRRRRSAAARSRRRPRCRRPRRGCRRRPAPRGRGRAPGCRPAPRAGRPSGARDPGLAVVVRRGHEAAAPDAAQRHPEAARAVGIEAQVAHHPAGERQVGAGVRPGAAAVAARRRPGRTVVPANTRSGLPGIEGDGPDVAPPDRQIAPVPGRRRGRTRRREHRSRRTRPDADRRRGESDQASSGSSEFRRRRLLIPCTDDLRQNRDGDFPRAVAADRQTDRRVQPDC